MKIRVTEAVSGRADQLESIDQSLTQIDPGEYIVSTHPSGHLKLEMPNKQSAYMAFDDFENGVKMGFIVVNS
jgi:hypothetical protein